jgi:long-chain fatty acid transport protein
LLSGARNVTANPADTFGLTSRSTAMGGAVSAGVADTSANYYNPSGLVLSEAIQLSIGAVHIAPELRSGDEPQPLPSIDAWQAGLVIPGHVLEVPVAVGLATQVAGNRLSRIVTFTEDDQRWFIYDNRPEQIYLAANVALRPTSWLSLGAGFALLASTDGTMHVTGSAEQPLGETTEYDSALEHEVVADLTSVRYPLFGATVLAAEWLDIALSYRGEGSVTLNVDSEIKGDVVFGPLLTIPVEYVLLSETVQSFVPRQVTLGTRYGALPEFDVHLDLTWIDWSAFPSPVSATSSELSADLPQGFDSLLPDLPPATALRSAYLSDRVVPRLGAEWRSADRNSVRWALRAGYVYEASPRSDESANHLLDGDRHVLSIGAGVGVFDFGPTGRGPLRIDVHGQLGLVEERRLRTPAAGTTTAGGDVWALGSTLGLHL